MKNVFSLILLNNQSNSQIISATLKKNLPVDVEYINSCYFVGFNQSGRYTFDYENSRLSFTFAEDLTEVEFKSFELNIELALQELSFEKAIITNNIH